MKKLLALALALCMVFALCACGQQAAAPAAEEPAAAPAEEAAPAEAESAIAGKQIAWVDFNLSTELQILLTAALEENFEKLGVDLLVVDSEGDAALQVSQVESFIAQGVDLIMMSAADAEASCVAVDECNEAGIPIMIVNATLNNVDEALCYVGCNDLDAGKILMQYSAETMGGKGNICVLRGPDGLAASELRTSGINEVLEDYPDITVCSSQACNWLTQLAMSTTENWLQNYELNAIVSENDEMALGAVEAIKGQGLTTKDVMVFGIDGIALAYESISKGEMTGTLLQDAAAIGAKAVEVANLYFETGSVESEYLVPWTVVDASNIDQYYKG